MKPSKLSAGGSDSPKKALVRWLLLAGGGSAAVLLVLGYALVHPRHAATKQRVKIPTRPTVLAVQPVRTIPPLPTSVKGAPTSKVLAVVQSIKQAMDPNLSYDARIRYIDHLSANLSAADQTALLNYLQNPSAGEGLSIEEQHALRNDLINVLRNQHEPRPELTDVMARMYEDPQTDSVSRDYAIQHLSEWRWRAGRQDPAAIVTIDKVLWSAVDQSQESFSGTALLALARIADDPTMPDHQGLNTPAYRERLGKASLRIAADEKANLASRISALSVCGRIGDLAAASLARDIAQHDPNTMLRVSAIHVAAQLTDGGDPDPTFMQSLTSESKASDPRIQTAAKAALALLGASR